MRVFFVFGIIEALCGATYEELVDDYFVTYHNYYGVEKGSKKYEIIKELHIDEMIRCRPNYRNRHQAIRNALTNLQFYNQAPLPSYEACRLALC